VTGIGDCGREDVRTQEVCAGGPPYYDTAWVGFRLSRRARARGFWRARPPCVRGPAGEETRRGRNPRRPAGKASQGRGVCFFVCAQLPGGARPPCRAALVWDRRCCCCCPGGGAFPRLAKQKKAGRAGRALRPAPPPPKKSIEDKHSPSFFSLSLPRLSPGSSSAACSSSSRPPPARGRCTPGCGTRACRTAPCSAPSACKTTRASGPGPRRQSRRGTRRPQSAPCSRRGSASARTASTRSRTSSRTRRPPA